MKILHVLAQLPSMTGSGTYFSSVIEGLKKYNHKQKAIFAFQNINNFNLLDKSSQYPLEFKTKELPFPIVGMSDEMPYENTKYSEMSEEMVSGFISQFRKILNRAKNEFSPDIIISHHLWLLTSLTIEIFPNTKIITVCHNTDLRQAKQQPVFFQKYVSNINKSSKIISLSLLQNLEISKMYNIPLEKIITLGGGFNNKIFYPKKEIKRKNNIVRLVYSAKISKSKGIFELIKAFNSLCNKTENIVLTIIGNPDKENKEKILLLSEGNPYIEFSHSANQAELADMLRENDIFIMPSYFEGLGLIAIESLACGLFVVSTEIEGLVAMLGDKINTSKVIDYVKLPRIYDTDKPFEDDLPEFILNLEKAMLGQIERIRAGETFPKEIYDKINKLSWEKLADKINQELV